VLAGLAVIALLGLLTWAMAAYISRGGAETSERLAPTTLTLGSVEARAEEIAEDGPLLIPGLATTTGERSIVVDHEGDDPANGWVVYDAHPADRDATCAVEQVRGTAQFVDCEGRTIDVTDLAPPASGVRPVVERRETLVIDLRGDSAPATPAGSSDDATG
jgi:hypothetical protein